MAEEHVTDPVGQARIKLDLLTSWIKAAIWFDDYVELRFPDGFDATDIVATDGVRVYTRRGECRDIFIRLDGLVCRLYDAGGQELRYPGQGDFPILKEWMQLYLSLGQGRPEGMDWIRFHIEPGTVRFELEGRSVKDPQGEYTKFVVRFDRTS